MTKNKHYSLGQVLPYILIIAAIIGLLASLILTYDKIHVLQDSGYSPPCNINPIFSCGSVMKTEQASLLGVPNSIFGIMGYAALLTFGVIVATGARLSRSLWITAQIAATMGVIFMHYLFFQGVYRINAICPWCFVIWMITIPAFWYLTLYNLQVKNFTLFRPILSWSSFMQRNHGNILLTWYAIILAILLEHFWYYWSGWLG